MSRIRGLRSLGGWGRRGGLRGWERWGGVGLKGEGGGRGGGQ